MTIWGREPEFPTSYVVVFLCLMSWGERWLLRGDCWEVFVQRWLFRGDCSEVIVERWLLRGDCWEVIVQSDCSEVIVQRWLFRGDCSKHIMMLTYKNNNVSFEGFLRKSQPGTSHWQTLSCIMYTVPWSRIKLTTLVVTGMGYMGKCKSNYDTITSMTTSIKPYKPCGITLVFSGVLACFTTSFNIFLSFSPTNVTDLKKNLNQHRILVYLKYCMYQGSVVYWFI